MTSNHQNCDVRGLFGELLNWHRKNHRKTLGLLNPGMSPEVARTRLSWFPYIPSRALELWYSCHDGYSDETLNSGVLIDELALFPSYFPLSISQSKVRYDLICSVHGENAYGQMFPILSNAGGDSYLVTCANQQELDSPITHMKVDDPDSPTIYRGIEPMLRTLVDCAESGAFTIDSTGAFMRDVDAFRRVARKHNPRVRYWR